MNRETLGRCNICAVLHPPVCAYTRVHTLTELLAHAGYLQERALSHTRSCANTQRLAHLDAELLFLVIVHQQEELLVVHRVGAVLDNLAALGAALTHLQGRIRAHTTHSDGLQSGTHAGIAC